MELFNFFLNHPRVVLTGDSFEFGDVRQISSDFLVGVTDKRQEWKNLCDSLERKGKSKAHTKGYVIAKQDQGTAVGRKWNDLCEDF